MGQASGADHQRQGIDEHVQRAAHDLGGVLLEAQIRDHRVKLAKQRHGAVAGCIAAAEPDLRDRIAGQGQRDEDGRDGVGQDQHDILRNLGVGDALHAAEHRVDGDDTHADVKAHVVRYFEEAGERNTDALHLADDVGDGGQDQADDADDACCLRVVPVTDELRHRELAELAQVRGQQQRQQHIAAGPAHQEDRGAVAFEGDQAGHGDKRGGGHPVRAGGHAVGNGVNSLAGNVELTGGRSTCPDGNADVQREGRADDRIGPHIEI